MLNDVFNIAAVDASGIVGVAASVVAVVVAYEVAPR